MDYLTKTRAYNPKTGRFLPRDILDEDAKDGYDGFPFGKDAIGTNIYAWCNNNPVNRVDPSGLDSFEEWGRRFGGFVGGLFGRSDLGAAIGGYIGDRIDYAVGYAGISLGNNSGYNFSGYIAGNRARAKQAKPAPEKVLKSFYEKSGTPGNFTARGNTYSAQTSFTSQNAESFLGGGLSSSGSQCSPAGSALSGVANHLGFP